MRSASCEVLHEECFMRRTLCYRFIIQTEYYNCSLIAHITIIVLNAYLSAVRWTCSYLLLLSAMSGTTGSSALQAVA